MVDQQVGSIVATAAAQPNVSSIDPSTYIFNEPFELNLSGQYMGTRLSVPAGTMITLGSQQFQNLGPIVIGLTQLLQWFTITVIVSGNDMFAKGSSDGSDLGLYSNMLYVSPEGITLSPAATLTFSLFPNASDLMSRRRGGAHLPLSLFSWDKIARTWVKIRDVQSSDGASVSTDVNSFGTFVVASPTRAQWPWWWWLILLFLLLALLCICCICICLIMYCRKRAKPPQPLADPAYSHRKADSEPDIPPTPSSPPDKINQSSYQLQADDSYLANSSPEVTKSVTKVEKVEISDGIFAQDTLVSQRTTRQHMGSHRPIAADVPGRLQVVPHTVVLQPTAISVPRSPLPTQAVNQDESAIVPENLHTSVRSLNPRAPAPNHALQVVDDFNVYVSGGIPGKYARDIDHAIPSNTWTISSSEYTPSRDTPRRHVPSYLGHSPRVLPFTFTTSENVGGEKDADNGSEIDRNVASGGPQSDWC